MSEDLTPLAQLKIGRAVDRLARENSSRLSEIIADHARRGLSQSGMLNAAKARSQLQFVRELCEEVRQVWVDLIRAKDGALTLQSVEFVSQRVKEVAENQKRNLRQAWGAGGPSPPPSITSELDGEISAIESTIRRDLEIQRREEELLAGRDQTGKESEEVFIVMAAKADLEPLLQEALAPAVKDNALSPYVMTTREPEGTITDEILSRIESARLVLADLTYERPNCYYEVGYAHALEKKVIFSARRDHDPRRENRGPSDPKIHFDLDSHKFSFWDDGDWTSLRVELRDRIAEWLRSIKIAATPAARRSEAGESELLRYLRATQEGTKGRVIFHDRAIAQELGWPPGDVQFALQRLTNKGVVEAVAGGHALRSGSD